MFRNLVVFFFWLFLKFCFLLYLCHRIGEMAEWSIAAVLKTVEVRASGGSNPSLSATNAENQQIAKQTPSFTPKNVKSVFLFYLR